MGIPRFISITVVSQQVDNRDSPLLISWFTQAGSRLPRILLGVTSTLYQEGHPERMWFLERITVSRKNCPKDILSWDQSSEEGLVCGRRHWREGLQRPDKARVASAESGGLEDVSIWNASLFQFVHICQFVLCSSPCLEVTEAASVKALNTELGSIVCTQLFSRSHRACCTEPAAHRAADRPPNAVKSVLSHPQSVALK